ncbi:MAG: LytR C-terminal domain-containing protein [Actinomycetota bacterium]|nr:LytR C-terminal domain-containing protein [Actinomycetota bacterium]
MEHSLDFDGSVRPWRTLTLIATAVAVVEFFVIFGAFAAKPLVASLKEAAATQATKGGRGGLPKPPPIAAPRVSRTETTVLVLNGNGRTGAAARTAARVRARGYPIGGVADARRTNYTQSIVMYRAGYRAEAHRLARDVRIRVVAPLDGIGRRELGGARLALIVGKRPL